MSFIEVLVAIVLLGTAVVGTLTALRATVIGTTIERDHARAHAWLQSASELLTNDVVWTDCNPATGASLQATYQVALRASTSPPANWSANPQLTVSQVVSFAGPSGAYGSTCVDSIDRQLVTIQVTNTAGQLIETVEVVKAP